MSAAALFYRIDRRAEGDRPGHHRSRHGGAGIEFRRHAGLLDAPDPRRYDAHASLRDPFARPRFRVYAQTSAVTVWVLADLSASMIAPGCKRDTLAELTAELAEAAWRTGDHFGFVGGDDRVRPEWWLAPTRQRGAGTTLAQRLRAHPFSGAADGLLPAAGLLGRRRSLVFLVSDFHLPTVLVARLLAALAPHQLVPVVLQDPAEYRELPRYGWVRLRDPESGRLRGLFLRPALNAAIRAGYAHHRRRLEDLFRRHGRRPLWLDQGYSATAVTRYFHG
ncbi:MAG: hypothetical protein R3202_03760 [Candidatus Competibacterales bacterium]|nr:hypothetical protein [Candidatus Competibacterales bacterium]